MAVKERGGKCALTLGGRGKEFIIRIMTCMKACTMIHTAKELKARILASITSRSDASTVTVWVTMAVTVTASLHQCQWSALPLTRVGWRRCCVMRLPG